MQKLAEVSIKRPVFAAMLILALVVVGAAAYFKLGVDRVPSVDLPTVSIRTNLPGAAPEEMESEVAERIEEVVNTIEGIYELRSICSSGRCFTIISFNLDRDINVAAQDVRDRVAQVTRDLNQIGADPPVVEKQDSDDAPVMQIAVSGPRKVRELTELADKVVKERVERSEGVGKVELWGNKDRTINLWLNADKLAAYNLPVTAVREAVGRENSDVPGGNVTTAVTEANLRTMGKLTSAAAFDEMIITRVNGVPVRLQDVGRAEDGIGETRSQSRLYSFPGPGEEGVEKLDGVPVVTVSVYKQSGANSVAVIEGVKARLAEVRSALPPDVQLKVVRDQSAYIYAALHEIDLHLILGSALACLVVLLFMRSWRSTIIAGVAIPASVVSTFGMMWALDFTLNSVTMLALVLMVGIVIDDAIVVLENIFRFVEEKKMTPREAARAATAEIGLAVMATTLSLVVIFIPVSFMSSVSGRFLYQFGITAAVSVMVSLLVSFTLTPMMSARLLKKEDAGGHGAGGHDAGGGARSRGGFYGLLDRSYAWMLAWSMRLRWGVAVVAVLVVAASVPLYRVVKQEFTPGNVDEAEFEIRITAPEQTSPPAMNEAMLRIEEDLKAVRGVRTMLAQAGSGFGGQANGGQVYVAIEPVDGRVFSVSRLFHALLNGDPGAAFRGNYSQQDVMQEMRRRLAKYKDLRCAVRGFPAFSLGGGNFEIDYMIRGPELDKLSEYTETLRSKALAAGGFADLDTTLKLNKPELRVEIDRERAGDLGVSTADIGQALRLMVGGDERVSRFRDAALNEDYDVRLRLEEPDRDDPRKVTQLYLPSRTGRLVELSNLATVTPSKAPARIDRIDRQRAAAVRGGVAPGYALADRLEVMRSIEKELNLPPTYTTRVAGRGRELERTFTEFLWAFLLSVIFMYMILASQYESLVHPLTILLSLPLSVPFALLSLWATGGTLNLYSALGMLVLFGVVKKNAILQIDHMNKLREEYGMNRHDAIMQGNRDRLRPILMTTLALVAGMLPLAVGAGPGAEERRAVAIVVIGGQSLSLLLTLLVTPVVYSIFDDIAGLIRRRKREAAPAQLVGA